MKIVVVGAGIYGLSTALELCVRGHEVEVIDKGSMPNPTSSSYDEHRLIRHAYGPQQGYAALIPPAFKAWDDVWRHIGTSCYIETGALAIGEAQQNWLKQSVESLQAMAIPHEWYTRSQVESTLPWLQMHPEDAFLYTPLGGILRARNILRELVSFLRNNGCSLHEYKEITRWDFRRGSVVDSDGKVYRGDKLVLALGKEHYMLLPNELQIFRQVTSLHENIPVAASVEAGCPMVLDISENHGFYYVPGSNHFSAKIGDHITNFTAPLLPYEGAPSPPRDQPMNAQTLDFAQPVSAQEKQNIIDVAAYRLKTPQAWPTTTWQLCHYSCTPDRTIRFDKKDRASMIYGGSGHGFKFGAYFGQVVAAEVEGKLSADEAATIIAGKKPISGTF